MDTLYSWALKFHEFWNFTIFVAPYLRSNGKCAFSFLCGSSLNATVKELYKLVLYANHIKNKGVVAILLRHHVYGVVALADLFSCMSILDILHCFSEEQFTVKRCCFSAVTSCRFAYKFILAPFIFKFCGHKHSCMNWNKTQCFYGSEMGQSEVHVANAK